MKRILILLLIITGLYIVFNKGLDFNWFASANSGTHTAAINTATKMINVDVASVNTTMVPAKRTNLKAVYQGKEKLTVKENGDEVTVSLKGNWFDWFDWFNWFSSKKHQKLTIYIPEDYNRGININLGSGNINFSGNHALKLENLTMDIGSGNMNLNSLSAKKFVLDTASGNVKVDSLKTKDSSIVLWSGNIVMDHYSGPVKADVSSGRLNIQMDKLSDSIDVDLSSGLVNLDLPDHADFSLNGKVRSGNISCEFPLTTKNTSHKNINGTSGSGENKINLSVSSGLINIK